jgi:hypothetical protein
MTTIAHNQLTKIENAAIQSIIDECCLLNALHYENEGRAHIDYIVESSCRNLDFPPSIYEIIGDLVERHIAHLLSWHDRLKSAAEEHGLSEAAIDTVLAALDQDGPGAATEALTRAIGWVDASGRTRMLEAAWQADPNPEFVFDGKRWTVAGRFVAPDGSSEFLIRSGNEYRTVEGGQLVHVL